MEERRRLQEELSEFVESCCRTLEEVTVSLGWSLDRLEPGEEQAAEVRVAKARGPSGGLSACGVLRRAAEGRAWGPPSVCGTVAGARARARSASDAPRSRAGAREGARGAPHPIPCEARRPRASCKRGRGAGDGRSGAYLENNECVSECC